MGQTLSFFWDQTYFIPKPSFTEKDLPDQSGKVHIITGGYTGIGIELAKLLYQRNATLYLAGRSSEKAFSAINALRKEFPAAKGRLEFLFLDLADLSTIKKSVDEFLSKEKRLDVLMNNAGVMVPPTHLKSAQGHDLQFATNIYGPWLFTRLLLPILRDTVKVAETGTVRVCWAASFAVEIAPKGGIAFEGNGKIKEISGPDGYAVTKAANVMLGVETAKRWGTEGVVSTSFNPGHLASELDRHSNWAQIFIMKMIRHPVYFGAFTELFAGWAPDITAAKNGCYVIPWGRIGSYNAALQKAVQPVTDGGEGRSEMLWEACEDICRDYM